MKKISLFVYAVILVVLLSGCIFYKPWEGKRPCDQPGTEWASKNSEVVFSVNNHANGIGKIIKYDEEIDVFIAFGSAQQMWIYHAEDVTITYDDGVRCEWYNDDPIECWYGAFKRSDRFTAEIRETTYFKEGETITFYRKD